MPSQLTDPSLTPPHQYSTRSHMLGVLYGGMLMGFLKGVLVISPVCMYAHKLSLEKIIKAEDTKTAEILCMFTNCPLKTMSQAK